MIATTIEQSRHLRELGLNPKTADMYYNPLNMDYPWVWESKPLLEIDAVPAWSLSALLEVMPKPDLYREVADLWVCVTFFKSGSVRGFGKTAIEAVCDTITKMFKNGLLFKKGEQDR